MAPAELYVLSIMQLHQGKMAEHNVEFVPRFFPLTLGLGHNVVGHMKAEQTKKSSKTLLRLLQRQEVNLFSARSSAHSASNSFLLIC